MQTTQAAPRPRRYRKVASLPVLKTEEDECRRMLADYGDGQAWDGAQPSDLAYLRDALQRGKSALPGRVLRLLLWNGKAVRLCNYIDARRRAKLGQSHVADIPTLIVEETQAEADADVLEVQELAGTLDRAGEIEAAERLRTHAHRALALSNALLDKAYGRAA